MQNMIEIFEDPIPELKDEDIGVNFDYFESGKDELKLKKTIDPAPIQKAKRPRKKKLADGKEVVVENANPVQTELNEPYIDSYTETNSMLRQSVAQIDQLSAEIKTELDTIRASKTLKNKYNHIADLTATSGTLLGTKITAIREMNKVISDCHNLEIKRIKDLKLDQQDQDDDKKIMDLYNAFINAPISQGIGTAAAQQIIPASADITVGTNGINPIFTGADVYDSGYASYLANLTPEQNRMRMENNPNIQTIVVFNPETGERHFDVIDRTTGQSIPNISRPDPFLFEDIHIDVRNQVARNTALDISYPLVVTGGSGAINEY